MSEARIGAPVRRILFIRLSAVGDVINTLPTLNAVRKGLPDARIGYIVEDRARDVIEGNPFIDRVHIFPRRRWVRLLRSPVRWPRLVREMAALIAEMRRERYDAALDFQGNLKGAVHGLACGARWRVGFSRLHCKELNHLFSNFHVTPRGGRIHRVEKFLSMASALGVPVNGVEYPLPSSEECRERVRSFFRGHRIEAGKYVVIHPGTSHFGRLKRWMPERFSEVAETVGRQYKLRSVVTWGPSELDLAEKVADGSDGHAVVSMKTDSLLDLAEIVRHSRLFVGCDSGPLHLASAVGVPSVGLFGPKDPYIYGPRSNESRVVYKPEASNSMGAITVEDVEKAVDEILGR